MARAVFPDYSAICTTAATMNETPQLFAAATGAGTAILGALVLAFVLALGLVVVYMLARRSGQGRARVELDAVADDLRARIETLAEELKLARETSARPSGVTAVDEIATSIDLDQVLARTIDAAAALSGADAAMISVEVDKEPPVVAALGISVDAAEGQRFAQPPDAEAEAVAVSYHYPADVEESRVRASLAVPLAAVGGKSLGWLVVYSLASRPTLDDVADPLREIARRATPAVENALRDREARRLADLDALTGLHNRRYFHETLEREVARAQRYRRELALIVVDVDDFKTVNDEIGHLAGDGVLAEAADRLRGDEFAIVLPEAGLAQADQLFRRIQAAVAAPPLTPMRPFSFSAGIAELAESDDATSLFERADAALYRAKGAGKSRALPALESLPPEAIGTSVF